METTSPPVGSLPAAGGVLPPSAAYMQLGRVAAAAPAAAGAPATAEGAVRSATSALVPQYLGAIEIGDAAPDTGVGPHEPRDEEGGEPDGAAAPMPVVLEREMASRRRPQRVVPQS